MGSLHGPGRVSRGPLLAVGLLAAIVLVVGAALSVAQTVTPPPPSEQAAAEYLRSVVALVMQGDLADLCQLGSGTCERTLQSAEPGSTPHDPPTIVGSRVLAPGIAGDDAWSVGGRVLELCGRDGLDRPYYSEMLVFDNGSRLISIEPVFWIGLRIATDPTVGGRPASPADMCPGL